MPEAAKCINAVSHRSSIYVVGGTLRTVLKLDTETEVWERIGEQLVTERASCGVTLCSDKVSLYVCYKLNYPVQHPLNAIIIGLYSYTSLNLSTSPVSNVHKTYFCAQPCER